MDRLESFVRYVDISLVRTSDSIYIPTELHKDLTPLAEYNDKCYTMATVVEVISEIKYIESSVSGLPTGIYEVLTNKLLVLADDSSRTTKFAIEVNLEDVISGGYNKEVIKRNSNLEKRLTTVMLSSAENDFNMNILTHKLIRTQDDLRWFRLNCEISLNLPINDGLIINSYIEGIKLLHGDVYLDIPVEASFIEDLEKFSLDIPDGFILNKEKNILEVRVDNEYIVENSNYILTMNMDVMKTLSDVFDYRCDNVNIFYINNIPTLLNYINNDIIKSMSKKVNMGVNVFKINRFEFNNIDEHTFSLEVLYTSKDFKDVVCRFPIATIKSKFYSSDTAHKDLLNLINKKLMKYRGGDKDVLHISDYYLSWTQGSF